MIENRQRYWALKGVGRHKNYSIGNENGERVKRFNQNTAGYWKFCYARFFYFHTTLLQPNRFTALIVYLNIRFLNLKRSEDVLSETTGGKHFRQNSYQTIWPIWTYGIELCSALGSNIIHRFYSNILRTIVDTPWFVLIIQKDAVWFIYHVLYQGRRRLGRLIKRWAP